MFFVIYLWGCYTTNFNVATYSFYLFIMTKAIYFWHFDIWNDKVINTRLEILQWILRTLISITSNAFSSNLAGYDELVYKLSLKYLQQKGHDIENNKIQRVKINTNTIISWWCIYQNIKRQQLSSFGKSTNPFSRSNTQRRWHSCTIRPTRPDKIPSSWH